jgi:hypothetical protein
MPEATLNQTENGLVAEGEGWYVLNAREAKWLHSHGAGSYCGFEGDVRFPSRTRSARSASGTSSTALRTPRTRSSARAKDLV